MKVKDLIGKKVMLAEPTPTTSCKMYEIKGTVLWGIGERDLGYAVRNNDEVIITNDNGRNIKIGLSRFNVESYK
jgi:DNA replication initiation complex subunit (GINS family)